MAIQLCFNPCFSGSPASTFYWPKDCIAFRHSFNPCFSGSPASTFTGQSCIAFRHSFNPCFWKSRFNSTVNSTTSSLPYSFNPCFPSPLQLQVVHLNKIPVSFNPCFLEVPLQHYMFRQIKLVFLFQSLFFWKSRFN